MSNYQNLKLMGNAIQVQLMSQKLGSSKHFNINEHLASVCDKCFQNTADNYNILSLV